MINIYNIYKISREIILLLYILSSISSCSEQRCIDADDFGHAKFKVNAKYDASNFKGQSVYNQIAPWIKTQYSIKGANIIMMIKDWDYEKDGTEFISAWCPWYGEDKYTAALNMEGDPHKLSSICMRLPVCEFVDDQMCSKHYNADLVKAPCIFTKGVGLYTLITNKDPNKHISTKAMPDGVNFHVGQKRNPKHPIFKYIDRHGNMRDGGGIIYSLSPQDEAKLADNDLYFKILDKYYQDNSGYYEVIIKAGVDQTSYDPFSYIIKLVKSFLLGNDEDHGIVKQIFNKITNQPVYKGLISLMMVFFISITGIEYLRGSTKITNSDLISRILKISLVSLLLSNENSWKIFHDYIFVFFLDGTEFILDVIGSAADNGPGAANILGMMLSAETMSKLFSLLFADWKGFIYILLFFFALYFVLGILFELTITYLVSIVMISIILALGPIFLCFILFQSTRYLFTNYFNQLITYSIRPILLFTGITLISMIIKHEIYSSLGFPVCKANLFNFDTTISDQDLDDNNYHIGYIWLPHLNESIKHDAKTVPTLIPISHKKTEKEKFVNDTKQGEFCMAYECIAQRYPDLPFLDPDNENDKNRIIDFKNGNFVQLSGLLLIFIAVFLLKEVNKLSISVSEILSNSRANRANPNIAIDKMMGDAKKYIGAPISTISKQAVMSIKPIRQIAEKLDKINKLPGKIKENIENKIDNARIKSLKKDAFTNPNKAILHHIKSKYGIDNKDVSKTHIDDYKQALKNSLKNINPTLDNNYLNKISEQLMYKKFNDLKLEFAKAKYNRSYKDLNNEEQKSISIILDKKHNNISLNSLALRAEKAIDYQNKYVESHAKLSNKNIGIIGKNFGLLRGVQEHIHNRKLDKKIKQEKRKQIGRELYAAYKNAPNLILEKTKLRVSPNKDIDMSDPKNNRAKLTYMEQINHQKQLSKIKENEEYLYRVSKKKGEKITSPEYITNLKLSNSDKKIIDDHRKYANQEIANDVYKKLASNNNGLLMGDTYLRKYASDSEMVELINKLDLAKEKLYFQDDFIKGEELKIEQAKLLEQKIVNKYSNFDDINDQDQDVIKYNKTKGEIEEIEIRKDIIDESVNLYIDEVNDIRRSVNMPDHIPNKHTRIRKKLKTIQELMRNRDD